LTVGIVQHISTILRNDQLLFSFAPRESWLGRLGLLK
jgi:hypothetical protein